MRPRSLIINLLLTAASAAVNVSAQTSVKLDSNSFGAIEARHIGPAVTSGRIAAIDGGATDPRHIYVGRVWRGLEINQRRTDIQADLRQVPSSDRRGGCRSGASGNGLGRHR